MTQNNPLDIKVIPITKAALVTDLNASYIPEGAYTYARNAVRNSKEGDLGTIGNEPSTIPCIKTTLPFTGSVSLPDGTLLITSGNGINSEVGIGNPKDCSYVKLSTLSCFNFNPENPPVIGVARMDFNKSTVVTITDKTNPVRRLDLKKLPTIKDCDELLLWKKIQRPCLTLKKGQSGNMPNGSYSVVAAYIIDGQIFSDWFSITNRIQLYSETGSNSIEVSIEGLDTEFEQFALAVVGNYIDPITKGATKSAKIIGTFSTTTKTVSISDFLNVDYETIKLSQLVISKPSWVTAGIISSNSNYLIIADLVGRKEENYQLKAMSIKSHYIVEQVSADYYERDGQDVSAYRDENYDYYIQGMYVTGEGTDKFHIPGPDPTQTDRALVASVDVYEYDKQFQDCDTSKRVEKWQVENTAGEMIPTNDDFYCGRRVLGQGKMGVFLSTIPYPANTAMFGDKAGKPQQFHKMPDECKVPRYSKIDGKTYINILGVKFTNIPKFDNPEIIGYRIIRSDRKGGNGTIVARGLMTNIRGYRDEQLDQDIMFSNYGVNDLSPDVYLSSTQTSFKNGKEVNYNPVSQYYKDKFSFYSPHTSFEPRYTLGSEIKIESEEIATIKGNFENVYKHPKSKLMNQFAFWLAAAVGFIETSLILIGKNTSVATKSAINLNIATKGTVGTDPLLANIKTLPFGNSINSISDDFRINSVEDLVSLDIVGFIKKRLLAKDTNVFNTIKNILTLIASLGVKAPYSVFGGIVKAEEVFTIIRDFTGYTDYVLQFNYYAEFTSSKCVNTGNKRRRLIKDALYIPSDVVSIDDKVFNNYFREKTVLLELNKDIADPITIDNSRGTVSSYGLCSNPFNQVKSTGSAFYVTSKVINPNQYGQLGSAPSVSMHSCTLSFSSDKEFSETPILYGGDCIITRFQFQKKMQFFNQTIANSNFPDDVEYDYRKYYNIANARYWMDTTKYDFSNLLSGNLINYTRFSRTTTGKYNLDCKSDGRDNKAIARIDDAHMYLSYNGVIDFFVECDYNINFRERGERPHYSNKNSNLSQIFRSDRLEFDEEFKLNRVYNDLYTTEIFAQQQREDFDPDNPIPIEQPNSVIYSLPSSNLQKVDNWQYFLPVNFFHFSEGDFGKLTSIHKMDQDRIIFLFSKSSPYMSMGRDFLQLEGSGRKITIGDGGLFAQDPRETVPTDNNYAAGYSRYAFSNTHLGRFYPSANQGRIINADGFDDITRQGISYWCKTYMPIRLYHYFPNYPEDENPISGVGYLSAFDSFNETYYITKRDFAPKKEFVKDITYSTGKFLYKGRKISLRDKTYFNDISWTLSYSPLEKAFISWHDWHPDWTIQTENHFLSVKDNTIWKHNEAFDSFCNYYGKDYPFEVEFLSTSGQTVEIIKSLEYILEVYKYKNFGRDKFHMHHENFSHLIVSNTEQISPLLHLSYANPNPEENLQFPKKTSNISYDIAFFKEENKYRLNQFWDTVKDRGEFTNSEYHLFPTDESGYKSVINPEAINIDKPEEQRKKFRHYFNKFRLIKDVSGENKFITKLLNVKKNISIR